MCKITKSEVSENQIKLTTKILTVFNKKKQEIVSRHIQNAEKVT